MPTLKSFEPSTDVVGWKAWYTTDRFYTSAETRWDDLPSLGVLVIMLYFGERIRRVMAGTEYYASDGSRFSHQHEPHDWGKECRAPVSLIPMDEFNAVYDAAMADFEIP